MPTLTPTQVMANGAVAEAIRDVAGDDELLWGACQERIVEATGIFIKLAGNVGIELTDGALIGIGIAAAQTLDPARNEYHLHHAFNGWLGGPSNVPNSLRFSWEIKDKKGGKMNLATPPDTGTITTIPDITPERGAELLAAQNTMAVAHQSVLDAEDVFKAIGQIEAFEFTRQIADIAAAQVFERIKAGKKYKGLAYTDAEGKPRQIATLEEFCEVKLNRSARRIQELVKNLHVLGPDLYESAERIGFKARDYQALKALPQDEQEIVKTALAAESREQVQDILQDLVARHQSERTAAKKQAEDLEADLEARGKLLATKTEKLDQITMDLEKLKSLPPNKREALRLEQEQAAAQKLSTGVMAALAEVNKFLLLLAEIKAAEVSAYTKEHADQTASWFCQQIQLTLQENGIQADMAEIILPTWQRETAKQSPVDQEGR